jgi:8-oxo-dGTP pyrophosphatase MutT (NUDIX family)
MDKSAERLRPEPDREPKTQYAALPWRRTEGGVEVLLITSRETRRWVIPKGWPIKKLKPGESAAQEALEEAGVVGPTTRKAIGLFHYDKRLRSGRTQHVRVFVYGLEVTELKDEWPEKDQRERRWTSPAEAADLVDEKELKKLLTAFNA